MLLMFQTSWSLGTTDLKKKKKKTCFEHSTGEGVHCKITIGCEGASSVKPRRGEVQYLLKVYIGYIGYIYKGYYTNSAVSK